MALGDYESTEWNTMPRPYDELEQENLRLQRRLEKAEVVCKKGKALMESGENCAKEWRELRLALTAWEEVKG